MEIKYLVLGLVGFIGTILGIVVYNFLMSYIKKNKGLEKKPTVLITILYHEMFLDVFLFAILFPHKSFYEYFRDTIFQSSSTSIFAITFVLFMFFDFKIRHSIQKKKMAKGEKGFLKYYDLRNPLEKEDPDALTTKAE